MGPSRAHFLLALLVAVAAALLLLSHPVEARSGRWQRVAGRFQAARSRGGAASLCRRTDYPGLCMSTARGIRGGKVDPATLVHQTIRVAIRKARNARARINRYRGGGGGRVAKGELETCKSSYDSALSDLEASMKALRTGTVADVQINLSAVITDVETCEDTYAERGKKASPFAAASTAIRKYASNGLALSDLMKPR